MKKPFLSIVIPAYNEEGNFKRGVLFEIERYLKKQNFFWEVVLINDGSTDKTLDFFYSFTKKVKNFRVLNIPHGGKFKAVSAGVFEAKGDFILFTDFDQSTPISEVSKTLPLLKKGIDIVIGSRVGEGAKRINDPFFRYIRSRIFNLLVRIVLFLDIKDTQCGFKIFKSDVARNLFKKLKVTSTGHLEGGYMGAFDAEILFLAKKFHFKIKLIGVKWRYFKSQKLSFKEPFLMLFDILRIRFFDLSGKYEHVK